MLIEIWAMLTFQNFNTCQLAVWNSLLIFSYCLNVYALQDYARTGGRQPLLNYTGEWASQFAKLRLPHGAALCMSADTRQCKVLPSIFFFWPLWGLRLGSFEAWAAGSKSPILATIPNSLKGLRIANVSRNRARSIDSRYNALLISQNKDAFLPLGNTWSPKPHGEPQAQYCTIQGQDALGCSPTSSREMRLRNSILPPFIFFYPHIAIDVGQSTGSCAKYKGLSTWKVGEDFSPTQLL